MKDRHREIYAREPEGYQRLVAREDHRAALPAALSRICALEGAEITELGAGTGRLTGLLAPRARWIWAFDVARPMLEVAAGRVSGRCAFAQADHRAVPLPGAVADLAIEGWAFGGLAQLDQGASGDSVKRAVGELRRLVRPGGTALIIETLGTGREAPAPPTPALAGFYRWLEVEVGFESTWVRTDYRFESPEEAEELCRFFFGDGLGDAVAREGRREVPECTGIWWRRC